jgi:hypothetical protein
VEVDGVVYPVDRAESCVRLPQGAAPQAVTEYAWNKSGGDIHEIYPTGMRVWIVERTAEGYRARRTAQLDNVLQYAGSSIRITGKKGIRMITSLPKSLRKALMSKQGVNGWTLQEYGTAVAWDADLGGGALTLSHSAAKRAYAYRKGVADPIFKDTGKLIQYTNVLVGMTNDKCVPDLAMRPYMILSNAAGDRITLYGGTVHRSIGYIAWQNRKAFRPGTTSYRFIWDVIHHVYGNAYDADYKK